MVKKKAAGTTTRKTAGAADAVDEQLARYRSMRHFEVTAEPSGGSAKAKQEWSERGLPFVIQKHAATRLHYDFRLGWNGVLKSWAVTKGPSYVVADKRLAVQVEDHPMEYGGFEGIIPAGQYGGGTVMVWDQGTWQPRPGHTDVDAALRDGSLKIILHGTKLQGKWALIRMKGRAASETKPNWLLIKEHDEFEQPASAEAVTEAAPNSVVTGRSIEEIARSEDHVWNSKETAGTGQAWYRKNAAGGNGTAADTNDRTSKKAQNKSQLKTEPVDMEKLFQSLSQKLPLEKQPVFVKPQLALEAQAPPEGGGWLHELKLDGYRVQARKDGSEVQLLTRKGLDWTARMRAIAEEVARLPVEHVTLDGEVVVVTENGTTSFAALQAAFQEEERHPLTYFCFDLLHLEGRNPRELPLAERKQLLTELLGDADKTVVAVSEHLETGGARLFHEVCALGAEGIVSKRAEGRYLIGQRGGDWLKLKCLHEQEFVIGGFTLPGKGATGSEAVGALLLGYYPHAAQDGKQDRQLIYAGRTGTGFTQKAHRMLRQKLEALKLPPSQASKTGAFAAVPAEARRGAIWVRPELVAQVRFATWTADTLVRQAAFLGLREDKSANEVVREDAMPTPKHTTRGRDEGGTTKAVARSRDAHLSDDEAVAKMGHAASRSSASKTATGTSASHRVGKAVAAKRTETEHAAVRLTHPDKVLDATSGMTKQMLADFYWGVAERMLPHIAERPLSLVRCPEGSGKPCFFQKHVTAALPRQIETVEVPDKKTGKLEPYITLQTREALAGLAQLGVLEVHPWGSCNHDLEHPDRLIFDLDPDLGPDEAHAWATLGEAAMQLRTRLKQLGLESFLKTTGGKGLHVVAPIEPTRDWETAKEFAHRLVQAMEKANPALYLTKMTKAARVGKIYLDYLRNERGATAVAPYSPRARMGAAVSMPLAWSELKGERPLFQVAEFSAWRARLQRDPWKKLPELRQLLTDEALAAVGLRGARKAS
jgi:bifunctional non-homologous end joining protein LigD